MIDYDKFPNRNIACIDVMSFYASCMATLLNANYDKRAVRQISISITKLEDEHSMQLSLFDTKKWQVRKLGTTMDEIRTRYGSTAILRAVSLTDAGMAIKRSKLVGGHKG